MLRFFVFSLCFFITNYIFLHNTFCSEYDQQDDSITIEQSIDDEDESVVLLSYSSDSKEGKIIQTSVKCSDKESKNAPEDEEIQEEFKEISCDKVMEKDFANMRIIQLANNIADDMGIIMKVSLNR